MRLEGQEEVELHLRTFILEELLLMPYDGPDPLTDEVVDSLGYEQLAEYVEESYGLRLEDDDMKRENFESVAALAALVVAKR